MKTLPVSWSDFLSKVSAKGLCPQYTEDATLYYVFATEGQTITYETNLLKGSDDAQSFETTYKATYNKPLEIKAGVSRPTRVSPSPQPIGTIENWKGYVITLPAGETSASIDISWPSTVYLHGGKLITKSEEVGAYLNLDLIYVPMDIVAMASILDHAYIDDIHGLDFESPESMLISTEFSIRLSLRKDVASENDITVYVIAAFYK